MSRLKLALIGCGSIAEQHWHGIQQVATRVDVTAVIDVNQQAADAMAVKTGATAYTNIQTALADGDFDAVDIMLPHNLHEPAALASFAAGKHVLLEKPMAHTLDSCERILAAASRVQTVFMVAEQAQYWSDIIRARELLGEGAIGQTLSATGNFYDRANIASQGVLPWRYRLEAAGGGVTVDGGAHWIRPLRMMIGEIDEVVGATGRHISDMEGESWSRALLRFDNGVIATLNCLNVTHAAAPIELFRVTGTEGEIVITGGRNGELILYNNRNPRGLVVMDATEGKRESYGAEIKDFCDSVLDGTPMAATAVYSLGEFRTAQALYRSVESGRWEKVW